VLLSSFGYGLLAGKEDALSAAFLAALERWPTTGVPDRPESWLLTVARRKLIDSARSKRRNAPQMAESVAPRPTTPAEQGLDGPFWALT
jgi:RNA polymerase sigma-70 factor (ECF subfamily)